MELISIVHDLRLVKGANAKIKILKKHRDNEMWKKFLKYTYNPLVSFGVSAPVAFDFDNDQIDESMFKSFDDLASRKITGNKAKNLAKQMSMMFGEIPRLVLGKSIKAGISITTINKVYPGLITTFDTMKGKDVPIVEYPVMTSIKYDGVKVFAEVTDDLVQLYTSSGAKFHLSSLEREFCLGLTGMYEGELIHKEGKIVDRPVISGKLNSLLAGKKTDISDYKYMIYDWVSTEEWRSKESIMTWAVRQDILKSQFNMGFQDSMSVFHVKQNEHKSWDEVESMFNNLVSNGYEGTMSRYSSDVYTFKRVDRLIKKKSIRECVLKCVGTTPHTNPAKGLVGSLILEGTFTDKDAGLVNVTVNVGSGLSKFDINCEPERYIGNDIEVIYNSVTSTESGHSLFLPRFKRVVSV